jgi:hypothetical protein
MYQEDDPVGSERPKLGQDNYVREDLPDPWSKHTQHQLLVRELSLFQLIPMQVGQCSEYLKGSETT